jgi:hypothetical protein
VCEPYSDIYVFDHQTPDMAAGLFYPASVVTGPGEEVFLGITSRASRGESGNVSCWGFTGICHTSLWPAPFDNRRETVFAILMAVFVTSVLLTNTVGVKLFTAFGMTLPVSIVWYPLTFLITDVVSEVYGARRARLLVVMGFGMNLLLLAFSLVGIALPVSSVYPLQPDYENVFGPLWRLLFASMAAYQLAQMVDVQLFHF